MNTRLCPAKLSLAVVVAFSSWASLQAQQQPILWSPLLLVPLEMKGQLLRGSIAVAKRENEGTIGWDWISTDTGSKVRAVFPGEPAERAGILAGDVILSVGGYSIKDLDDLESLNPIRSARAGDVVNITYSRNGEIKTANVIVELTKKLFEKDAQWQQESKLPPAVRTGFKNTSA